MSASAKRSAARGYRMLLEPDALQDLLRTLANAGVTSFCYEDAKVKLEIVRESERTNAPAEQADQTLAK